jgi:hypothetical protein
VNCNAWQQQLQQTLDGAEPVDRTALEQHLHDCADCRAYHDAAQRLRAGLKLLRPPAAPPELTNRLVAAVVQDRLLRYRRGRRKLVVALAIAAGIIIVVGVRLWPGAAKPSPNAPESVKKDPDPLPNTVPEDQMATPRKSVETAVEAVASLTTRTTQRTVEETRKLIPLVGPQLPELSWEPAFPKVSLSGAGQGVTEGLEPIATHAKQAVSLLRRDFMQQF